MCAATTEATTRTYLQLDAIVGGVNSTRKHGASLPVYIRARVKLETRVPLVMSRLYIALDLALDSLDIYCAEAVRSNAVAKCRLCACVYLCHGRMGVVHDKLCS